MWKSRTGFARIALAAKCPVIPMFTENVRESFRAVTLFRPLFEWLYNLTKLPLVPLYGGFPVKGWVHQSSLLLYFSAGFHQIFSDLKLNSGQI